MSDLNPPIDDFICRTLRGEPVPWSALGSSPDEDDFLRRCEHHGVTSLIYHAMRERDEWRWWPAEIRAAIEKASRVQVAQEMLRGHQLQKLLHGFAEAGIPCLLTKGEALARTIYPIPGTRTRADSDLFIAIEDIGRARQAVLDNGFTVESPVYKSHQFIVKRFEADAASFEIDIHWRILNAPQFARTLSFEEGCSQSVEVPGMEPWRTLGLVDSLLLACMHRMGSERHDRNRLIWIYDIHLLAELLNSGQWMEFLEKTKSMNIQGPCLEGLTAACGCFHTGLPDNVISCLATADERPVLSRRYAESNIALLHDDWKSLPGMRARFGLLRELFLPDGYSLLHKYGKKRYRWLPLLYVRHVFNGVVRRVTLR